MPSQYIIPDEAIPQDLPSERQVLGAVLTNANLHLPTIRELVSCADFYYDSHAAVWAAILVVDDAGGHPTLVSVMDRLQSTGELESIGGVPALTELADGHAFIVSADAVLAAARKVATTSARRTLMKVSVGEPLAPEMLEQAVATLKGESIATSRLSTARASEVDVKPVRYLWDPVLPLGKLCLVAGQPGLGKSFLTVAMASHITTGSPWPLNGTPCEPGSVIMLSAEDDASDTIVPRAMAAGAALERLHIVRGVSTRGQPGCFSLTEHLALLERMITEIGDVRLVTVDPVSAYLGDRLDSHRNSAVRAVLAPLADLAERTGVSVVAVTHLRKGGVGSAMDRSIGSIAFVGAARSAWLVAKDPDDGRRRLLLPMKHNLSEDETGYAYRIETPPLAPDDGMQRAVVTWEREAVTVSADDVVNGTSSPGRNPDDRDRAEMFLIEQLHDGQRASAEIQAEAEERGIATRTLHRAKKALGVDSIKVGASWYWLLPDVPDIEAIVNPTDGERM